MPDKKRVLIVGIDPTVIDFSSPDYGIFPGLTAEKVLADLKDAEQKLENLGCEVQLCLTDSDETAEAMVREYLDRTRYHCVVIGAGIRSVPRNFLLFEKILNVVHAHGPQAKICFNTSPADTVEAVQRWL